MKKYKLLVSFILIISIFACLSAGAYADYADVPSVGIIASWLETLINQGSSWQHTKYVEEALKGIFSESYWIQANTQDMLSYLGVLEPINSNINYWGTTLDSDLALTNSRLNSINDNIKYAIYGSTTIDTSKSVYNMLSTINSNISTVNTLLADINLYTSYIPQINTKVGTISDNLVDVVLDVDNILTGINNIRTDVNSIKSYANTINSNISSIKTNTDEVETKLDTLNNDFYGTFYYNWSLSASNNGRRTSIFEILLSNYGRLTNINSSVSDISTNINALSTTLNGLVKGTYHPNWFFGTGQDGQEVSLFNISLSTLNQLNTPHDPNRALVSGNSYTVAAYLDYIANNLNNINLTGDITANVDLVETNSLINNGNTKLNTLNSSVNTLSSYIQDNLRSSYNLNSVYPVAGNTQYSLGSWAKFIYNQSDIIRSSLSAADGQHYKTVAELSLETNQKLDRVIELLSEIAPDEETNNTQKDSVINWYNDLNFGNLELGDLALDLPTFDIGIVIPDLEYDSKDFPFEEIAAYTASYFGGDPNTGGW